MPPNLSNIHEEGAANRFRCFLGPRPILNRGTELISLNGSRRNEPTESTPEDDYNAWKEASDDLTATRSIITNAKNGGMSKNAIDSFRERADKLQQTVEHYETMIPSLKKH